MTYSYTIVTDTSANLPAELLREQGIEVIPFSYSIAGEERTCLDTDSFREEEGERFYADLKAGVRVTTSQITPGEYVEALEPILKRGQDLLFIGMSSGISGSYDSSVIAAEQLRRAYPERIVRTVDSLAASLGEGKAVLRAAECRRKGLGVNETADLIEKERGTLYQVVLLDDLMFLHRGGRVSAPKALLGTVLGLRPILKGDRGGRLVVCGKAKGRRRAIEALAEKYRALVGRVKEQIVGIAYTDCPEDAYTLRDMLEAIWKPARFIIERYEPVTGSYVGPGTVALFFNGADGIRDN